MREDGGLSVVRGGELLLGAREHEPAESDAERVVDRLEGSARRGKPLREVLAHPDFLRALARTEPHHPRRCYHRTTMLAQVKPAPKAQNITVIPGVSRPVFTASSRAMAIDAAEVLPNLSTFT